MMTNEDSASGMFAGRTISCARADRDGIRDQVILLNELSARLDDYFALHTLMPENGTMGG